jgi:hypothetical protein
MAPVARPAHARGMQTLHHAPPPPSPTLAGDLGDLAAVLRESAERCDRAAARIAPHEALDETVCDRYRAAAARWPASSPPPYERVAAVLARLHDAGTAARAAARRCDAAREALT